MIFRKDSLLFYQSEIIYVAITMLCLALLPVLGVVFSLLCALPFVVLLLVNPKLHNEFIIINENGIICQKAGIQIWGYEWDSIVALKKSSRFLMPSIEIMVCTKCESTDQPSATGHYFQLGRIARSAMKQYHKPDGR